MDIYEKIIELKAANKPFAVCTIVHTWGSTPGKVGFKILVEDENRITGTIGGGALEQHVIEEAVRRIRYGGSGIQEYSLSDEIKSEDPSVKVIPMMCKGRLIIYYGIHGSLPTLYVFGGGHVGQELLYSVNKLGYHTVLIDNRKEFANDTVNPYASVILNEDYQDFAQNMQCPENSYAVILTQEHKYDYDVLKTLISGKKLKYIGVIASKSKATEMKKKLQEDLGDAVDLSLLHSPIGLKIGGTSAAEIALSIAAEIQAVRYGKYPLEK